MLADELHAGADSEDRDLGPVEIDAVVPHAVLIAGPSGSAAGENDPVGVGDVLERSGVGNDLRIDLEVPEDAPLAMRPLSPVIDYVYFHAAS